jgi:predicted Fe-Mo cluster-binding NifX family protein
MPVYMMSKTKVAIPVFGSKVSPRFDCAREILFVEFENGAVASRRTTAMEGMNPLQRLRAISTSGATMLVCSALPCFYRRMMDSSGIRIIHAEGMEVDVLIEHIKREVFTSLGLRGHRVCWKHRYNRYLLSD